MNDPTPEQQQFIDSVIDAENETKCRTISPGICSDCDTCLSENGYDEDQRFAFAQDIESGDCPDEGGFSHHDCECCGSSLAGDRYAAHGHDSDNEIVHYDICVDCLMYLANGILPGDTA